MLAAKADRNRVLKKMEDEFMKLAVTTENKNVFGHFGKCKCFTICEVSEGKVTASKEIDTSESGHSALVQVLQSEGVEVLLCGGIGQGAIDGLASAGIKVVPGIEGSVQGAVEGYLAGKQLGNPNFKCNHHDHDHEHSEGHECHCH